MAITIQTSPQNFSPASNPCVFTFSSTNTGEENFSFIVRLTINGAIHSYHQVFPEYRSYGKFDASEIIKAFVSSKLVESGLTVNTNTFTATYSIGVIEKYGDPAVEVGSYTTSSTLTTFNAALRHVDWIDYDFTTYRVDTNESFSDQRAFLSNFPISKNRFCGLTESQFLGLFCTDTAANIKITLLDTSGSQVATVTQALTIPSNNFFILDVSPSTIISDTTLTITNFNNSYSYNIEVIGNGGGGNTSTTVSPEIIIDRECSLYDGRRLHWLNKFGVWESFTFRLYSEDSTRVSSKDYQKGLGGWNASNEYVYNRVDGEQTVYTKTAMDETIINSDWIHESVQQWLSRSLYESPIVYLEVSEGVFEPVEVSKSNYKHKQRIKEGLIQENVKLKRTYKYQSQLN